MKSINHIDCTPQEFGSRIEAYNVVRTIHLARLFKWIIYPREQFIMVSSKSILRNSINNHA